MLSLVRPHGTSEQLEARRRRAVALLRNGETYRSVAVTLNASVSSVVRWAQSVRRGGAAALRAKPTPGRPPRLSERQKRRLVRLLKRDARAAGHTTARWTLPRIAKLIEKSFGVRYHSGHVWRVVKALRSSWKKPERRSTQRDKRSIARRKKRQRSGLTKSPKTRARSRITRRKRFVRRS
jgi:transposase